MATPPIIARKIAARLDVFAGEVAAALPTVMRGNRQLQRQRQRDETDQPQAAARGGCRNGGRLRCEEREHQDAESTALIKLVASWAAAARMPVSCSAATSTIDVDATSG
jgi:hypothetical protein